MHVRRSRMAWVVSIIGSFLLAAWGHAGAGEPGLIGYWRFDEGQGDRAVDSSGNSNDGDILGADWASGPFGTALHFDGSGQHVAIPELAGLDGSTALKQTCRVRSSSAGAGPLERKPRPIRRTRPSIIYTLATVASFPTSTRRSSMKSPSPLPVSITNVAWTRSTWMVRKLCVDATESAVCDRRFLHGSNARRWSKPVVGTIFPGRFILVSEPGTIPSGA